MVHSKALCKHVCNQWEKFLLLGLVIKQFSLLLLATYVFELSSNGWVSHSNQKLLTKHRRPSADYRKSSFKHRWVDNSQIAFNRDSTLSVNFQESAWHVFPRDSHIVKCQPTIILTGVSKLRTHVAAFNSRHMFVSVSISNLNDKRIDSIITLLSLFVYDNKLCKNKGMIGHSSHVSWPPFGSGNGRRIYNKFISFLVENGCSLKSCNVRAMT